MLDSYNLLLIKRRRLKTGATTFVFKRLFYGEWLIAQWFEMEFISQTSPYELRKKIENTLQILEWSWDFKTFLILITVFGVGFSHYSPFFVDYYYIYIAGGFEPLVVRTGLESIFTMTEYKKFGALNPIIYNLTSMLVDLALFFNLF